MPTNRLRAYVLGLRVNRHIEGDVLFDGNGYILERKVDGIIVPATVSLSGNFQFDFDNAYGRFDELTESQQETLTSLVNEMLGSKIARRNLVKGLQRTREIENGVFERLPLVAAPQRFRPELIQRIREKGSFVYSSLGKDIYFKEGPIRNGGVNFNLTGKISTKGKNE